MLIDWSLLIIFGLIAFNLGAGVFPAWHPLWPAPLSWVVALAAALLFLASVLAHELAHATTARSLGIPVRRITLFLFGGVAQLEGEPPTPKAEFLMTIVGPLASIGIGISASLAGLALAGPAVISALLNQDQVALHSALAALGPVATLLLWLGPINLVLGIFNLVPGFPLDGGRVLRAALWAATHDLARATRWATAAGRLVAFGLMAIGVMDLFSGAIVQGVWMLLIGWFLSNAAKASYEQFIAREGLRGVAVERVMRRHLDRVTAELSLERFVQDTLMASDQRAFPVERDGALLGLVCLHDVRKVPQQQWPTTPVAAVMTPVAQLTTLPANAEAAGALELLTRRDVDQIPIVEGDHLVGLVRTRDLMKWLSLRGITPAPSAA